MRLKEISSKINLNFAANFAKPENHHQRNFPENLTRKLFCLVKPTKAKPENFVLAHKLLLFVAGVSRKAEHKLKTC